MTSAHTTLRELVRHLARAQRAFDAGRLDEAERAIADALALDPHNVQAADLRLRIGKDRQPAGQSRTAAPPPNRGAAASAIPVRPGPSPAGRVSPAAWSTFEARVRGRRADRAVAEAEAALGRGDVETAHAALAELDAVSPADPRRDAIAASLQPRPADRVSIPARPTVAGQGPAAPRARPAAALAPRPPSEPSPAAAPPARSASAVRTAAAAAPSAAAARLTPLELPLADLPIDIGLQPADSDLAWAAAPRVVAAAPEPKVRRSWAKGGVAFGAVAASALLGFWLLSARGPDVVPAEPARERSQAAVARTPEAPVAPQADLPEPVPSFTPPPVFATEQDLTPLSELVGAPFEAVTESGATVLPSLPSSQPEVPRATSESSTTPRPARENRMREAAPSTAPTRPDVARAEPAPSPPAAAPSSPLTAPVESPIRAPETVRLTGPSGAEPLAREVTPLPAPPAPAVTAPAPASASPASGALETSAVRGVLDGYADAFSSLNADATQRLWPGVDIRGLRRAFDQLSTQNITFNRCEVNASGDTAQAVCTGRATWVPKVGDRSPKSEPRTWRFALGRDGGQWVIDGVQVQR